MSRLQCGTRVGPEGAQGGEAEVPIRDGTVAYRFVWGRLLATRGCLLLPWSGPTNEFASVEVELVRGSPDGRPQCRNADWQCLGPDEANLLARQPCNCSSSSTASRHTTGDA